MTNGASVNLPDTPAAFRGLLAGVGYLADDAVATAAFLALKMQRPLMLEGEPGAGKTALARAVAQALDRRLFRLQCYEGLDASEALYSWDFQRQLLHVRAAETTTAEGRSEVEARLYDRRFLLSRPILQSFETSPSVLLIDEVDRADDEFEAFLLEALSEFSITIPELGRIAAAEPPFTVLTSNRTREVHDALKRRCLFHWLDHPSAERELAVLQARFPAIPKDLAMQIVATVGRLRGEGLLKPPGVSETIDWAEALAALGATKLDEATFELTLGTVVKYHEDQLRIRSSFTLADAGA